jgi:hypothetical protein
MTLADLTHAAREAHDLHMLIVLTAALSMAALAPLNPLLPLSVNVTTPDGHHHVVPIDNTSGRIVAVCADPTSGGDAPVCAPVVASRRGLRAVFQQSDSIDSSGALRMQIASPNMGSDGATAIAIGCGLLGGAAVGGALVAGGVAGAEGASADTVDGANTAAAGLWLLGGASAVGTGVAVFFAVLDHAPQIE